MEKKNKFGMTVKEFNEFCLYREPEDLTQENFIDFLIERGELSDAKEVIARIINHTKVPKLPRY